jgi:hypothetical protein
MDKIALNDAMVWGESQTGHAKVLRDAISELQKQPDVRFTDPGMYAVHNPAYPQVKIGDFTVCRQDDSSVWIQRDGGEGGQFTDDIFAASLETFWKKHF